MAESPDKKKINFTDWRNQAFVERADRVALERRNELWQALNKWVIQQGAWVVSLPNVPRIRIEARRGSNLTIKLKQLGYEPRHCGVNTRVASSGFLPVDVIEISLPGK
jgi:hypothetical protein